MKLDAGALDGCRPSPRWIARFRSAVAGGRLAVGDAVEKLVDDFVSQRLGLEGSIDEDAIGLEADPDIDDPPREAAESDLAGSSARKAAVRRFAQDGLLLGLAHRSALGSLLGVKLLGLGGVALLAAAAGPPLIRRLSALPSRSTYLHPFDREMTAQNRRLIRYCDDFIILARSKPEAEEALAAASESLKTRRLRINAEKTRVAGPDAPFEFLGYPFTAGGRVIARISEERADKPKVSLHDSKSG
jgi:hypothetical protein